MDNTIQLYVDEKKKTKGYPITSPDRVIDENGVNIKDYVDEAINNAKLEGEDTQIDLSAYAKKTDLHSHSNKTILDNITTSKVNQWDNKSDFSGSYNDLTNKPTIPTKVSELTNDKGYLTSIPSEYINETELQVHTDQVLSAGEQLVLNGSQILQNNYNFSQLTYDGAVANNSGGSLLGGVGKRQDIISDYFFTINPNKPIYASFDVKGAVGSRMYAFVDFYDVDKQRISANTVMYQPNTLTRLTQDLKQGDTVVHFEDLTNWRDDLTTTSAKSFIFWNWTNSKGYTYPPETYSRNAFTNLYADSSSVDKVNKTITLTTAWNKGTIPAGTYVSQGNNGNNYRYMKGGSLAVTTEWKTIDYVYEGLDDTGSNIQSKLPPGTAFAKFGMFLNYNGVADEKVWITNIVVKEDVYSAVEKKADKTYVDTELAKKSDKSHTHSEYVTDSELNAKGYLTEHQDISGKVDKVNGYSLVSDTEISKLETLENYDDTEVRGLINKTNTSLERSVKFKVVGEGATVPPLENAESHSHSNKTVLDSISSAKITEWDNKSDFSGNYNDLTNKPTIPKASNYKTAYGTCPTTASTSEKVVIIDDPNWELEAGNIVAIMFSATNTASNVTINVNNTGAYPIWYSTSEYTSNSNTVCGSANLLITFMFNGTHWVWLARGTYSSYSPATLGQGYGVCDTAESTLAKECTISSYTLVAGGIVSIKFTNAVPTNSTLNIRTRGAKKIFYRGVAITSGIIKTGDTATFIYDGTQYHLISLDNAVGDVPTKTSQLTNDSGFLTSIPSEYVTESELHVSLKELEANLNNQTPQFVNSIEECVDTTKLYVLPDGYIYAYMYTEKTETVKGYTNKIPTSIDTDGSIYNGCGYKNGWRINSSLVEKEQSDCGITGFIRVTDGDVIRAENYGICTNGYQYVHQYNSNFQKAGSTPQSNDWLTTRKLEYTVPSNVGVYYIRLSLGEFTSNSIVTVNEEIKETTTTTTKYEWTNTNQKFIQGNYDEEINELEVKVNKNTSDIEILKNNQTVNSSNVMYVSPLGNDNNDGLTEDKPKLTFQACINAGATKISAKRGIYKKGISKVISNNDVEIEIYPTDNDKNRDIGETFDPIVIDLSDEILATDFISYNSIKRVAYSNSNNVPIKKVFVDKAYNPQYSNGSDYGCRWNSSIWLLSDDEKTVHKLKPVLTVAECESTINTFTYDGSYIYANADWTNITKVNVPYEYYNGILLQGFSKIKLTEVEVRFTGSYCFDLKACPNVELHKCSSKYTLYGSGFHPYNVNGVFKNCYATKCYDGFGISASGHTTYIDCISEFNFDDGASNHNTSEGTFIGGRYEGNGKAGNAPAYGCKVNIIGGLYKNNSIGIGYLSATGEGHADGMIQSAIIVGNTTGLAVNKDCNVICTTSYFEANTTQKDIKGNLTEYGNTIK